jgi:hypothetical protein
MNHLPAWFAPGITTMATPKKVNQEFPRRLEV